MLIAITARANRAFKSIVESYDNLATLRTEDPARHHLRIYFSADSREEVEAMMTSLATQFANREDWVACHPDKASNASGRKDLGQLRASGAGSGSEIASAVRLSL